MLEPCLNQEQEEALFKKRAFSFFWGGGEEVLGGSTNLNLFGQVKCKTKPLWIGGHNTSEDVHFWFRTAWLKVL